MFGVGTFLADCFEPNDRFRLFAEKIFPLLLAARQTLAEAYCADNGRPAEEPVLLLGACVLQFMERVPDRQAAECVRYHLGWKLALQRELTLDSFHPTTLHYFRQRLLDSEQAKLAFDAVLQGLKQAGLVARRSKQRLDSTHVLGLVSKMSGLDCVRETLRLALAELAQAGLACLPGFWPLLWERYVESKLDYRSEESVLAEKLALAGADAQGLLQWVATLKDTAHEAAMRGRQILMLQRVFEENFEPAAAAPAPASQPQSAPDAAAAPTPAMQTLEAAPTSTAIELVASEAIKPRRAQPADAVKNPHDPDARWSAKAKGKMTWVGYKAQVAETVAEQPREKGEPTLCFITSIVTQEAIGSDEAGMKLTLAEQKASGLAPPSEMYVDGAYVSAEVLKEAQEQGRELLGPAQMPANKASGFKPDAFDVDIENRQAVCPAGHASSNCSRLEEKASGKVSFRFEWGKQCHACPLSGQCVGKNQTHRTLNVGEHHAYLQERRREQQTEPFKRRMQQRNAIEGTQSELVRGHGLRQARYRGLEKVRLQNYFIGAACNAKRWIARSIWEAKQAAGRVLGGNQQATAAG